MECHRCQHREDVAAGKYVETPFEETPCAKCELLEVSMRTVAVDVERPVFVPGAERQGTSPRQAGCGISADASVHDEASTGDRRLPADVLEEFIVRFLALPPEVRDVVCWRFVGLGYREIAQRQGITPAGAELRHKRAMRMFPELRELFILKTARRKMRQGPGARSCEQG